MTMHTEYKTPLLKQLRDQQVRFAPLARKVIQVNRAEKLLGEIEPEKKYPYEYVCYRITDYRPESAPRTTISGEDLQNDLRMFIEDLSDATNMPADAAGEPVLTVDQLSERFNVSTKTISRWRQQGLVSRRFVFGKRKRIGFLQSSVDRFVARNRDRVERGERFSQLSDEERGEIVERARRLAKHGGAPSEVTRRIADNLHRSVETVRYTIKQFDEQNPGIAVFPDSSGPLSPEAKQKIYQQHRRGTSVAALAKMHGRTKTSIYRIVNEMRARRIMDLPLDYMYHESFDDPGNHEEILAPMPDPETKTRKPRLPSGLPSYLAALYEVPLLTREQEAHIFRKFNYLKHCAAELREELDPVRAKKSLMDKIEDYYDRAVKVKNQIIQANLRLVVSIAKRHVSATEDFFTLVSDGNMSLIRAVEKFDFSRGNKFSTYATWAIMKNFARTIPDEFKHRDRFRTSQDEMFVAAPDERTDRYEQESAQHQRVKEISKILSKLDEREQQIIVSRFGLNHNQEPQTLKEVGADMGVTKARALNKLRVAAQEEKLNLPDLF